MKYQIIIAVVMILNFKAFAGNHSVMPGGISQIAIERAGNYQDTSHSRNFRPPTDMFVKPIANRIDQLQRDRNRELSAMRASDVEAERIENLRKSKIEIKREELRNYLETFTRNADPNANFIAYFIQECCRNILEYPENIEIAERYFRDERREVYRLTLANLIYITHPASIEIEDWIKRIPDADIALVDDVRSDLIAPHHETATGCGTIINSDVPYWTIEKYKYASSDDIIKLARLILQSSGK